MPVYTCPPRRSSRTDKPFNPGQHHRDSFARGAVFVEFGRDAWALDQGDFEDRKPWEMPMRSPEARLR